MNPLNREYVLELNSRIITHVLRAMHPLIGALKSLLALIKYMSACLALNYTFPVTASSLQFHAHLNTY